MITGNSRYADSSKMYATGHSYDKYRRVLIDGDDPSSTEPMLQNNTILYRLPDSPSTSQNYLEYIAKEGDSLQLLAYTFLQNHNLWWTIADFNPHIWYPLDLEPGTVIKIPV
jgi:hypothetical protein